MIRNHIFHDLHAPETHIHIKIFPGCQKGMQLSIIFKIGSELRLLTATSFFNKVITLRRARKRWVGVVGGFHLFVMGYVCSF